MFIWLNIKEKQGYSRNSILRAVRAIDTLENVRSISALHKTLPHFDAKHL